MRAILELVLIRLTVDVCVQSVELQSVELFSIQLADTLSPVVAMPLRFYFGLFSFYSRLTTKGIQLGTAMAEMLSSETHSISHALLACMPCNEVVTTNYDTLFEQAIEAVGKRELHGFTMIAVYCINTACISLVHAFLILLEHIPVCVPAIGIEMLKQ